MAGYPAGFLNKRILIKNKIVATEFGETTKYDDGVCVHANKGWKHGIKGLREGALDAYDKALFRMNWNNVIRRDSQIVCDGKTYQILSLDGDHMENKIEALAQEIVE